MEDLIDRTFIKARLLVLPRWKSIAFSLGTCERMLPWFRAFADPIGYKGDDVLRDAVNVVWNMLASRKDRLNLKSYAKSCDSVAPHMDDYGDMKYGLGAMNAACAIALLMESISGNMDECGSIIASQAIDVVYDLAEDEMNVIGPALSTNDLKMRTIHHPLMQAELQRERDDLEFVESLDDDSALSLSSMIERWKPEGRHLNNSLDLSREL